MQTYCHECDIAVQSFLRDENLLSERVRLDPVQEHTTYHAAQLVQEVL